MSQTGYVQAVFPSGMGAEFRPAFDAATAFWNNVVTTGQAGFTFDANLNVRFRCGVSHTYPQGYRMNGLEILAEVVPIDGRGGILGQAGPCYFNDDFPVVGIMKFDSADSQSLLNGGQFDQVIIHEMGHVVGIGGLWSQFDLVRNPCPGSSAPCTTNPIYVGAHGIEGFRDLGGEGELLVGNERGPGTWNAHWREETFANELMTGFLNNAAPNPFSIMSVKSMRDMGYGVNLESSEEYEIPNPLARPLGGESVALVGEMLEFDHIDIKDELRRIRDEAAAAAGNDDEQMFSLMAVMVLGFLMLAASMFYTSKKQSDAIKKLSGMQAARIVKEKVIEP